MIDFRTARSHATAHRRLRASGLRAPDAWSASACDRTSCPASSCHDAKVVARPPTEHPRMSSPDFRSNRPAKSRSSLRHLCLTSRDFVPWRFLDAGQLSLRSLFVAGVQKPSHNQTQAPQQRSRIECIIPSANVRGATSHYSETRVIVVECEVPSESAPGKTLIDRADFSDAYRAPQ